MGRASSAYIGVSGLILAWHGAKELAVFFPYPYTIVNNAIMPFQGCFFTVAAYKLQSDGRNTNFVEGFNIILKVYKTVCFLIVLNTRFLTLYMLKVTGCFWNTLLPTMAQRTSK